VGKKEIHFGGDAAELGSEPEAIDEPDVGGDAGRLPDAEEDTAEPIECPEAPGCFGWPCTGNDECLSGYCVEHLGEGICSDGCIEECPEGWSCELAAGFGPDELWVCLSPFANLCRPCHDSSDCISPSGVEDVCAIYPGEGNFCGAPCEFSTDCPEGFECGEVNTVGGAPVKQCMNLLGVCDCTDKYVSLGLTAYCENSNEWGVCAGQRTCTADGLAMCDAATPGAEICNGQDDNCDGIVDDADCDDNNDCTADECTADGCVNEPLSGTTCEDSAPCTITDHCEDGECVGTPVVCDDGNPCTDDECSGDSGCQFEANTLPCDDTNPCTVGDHCSDTECIGTGVDCDCQTDFDCVALEDGDACNGTLYCDKTGTPFVCAVNPGTIVQCQEGPSGGTACTETGCEPDTGECIDYPLADGTSCDDSDACTTGEHCDAGECVTGNTLSCNDGNPCTDDFCQPGSGCQFVPNVEPCDDGNACTENDQCEGATCKAGSPLDCNDNNICTDDTCHPLTGCQSGFNTNPCDDNNKCTQEDSCVAGVCVPGPELNCDDENPCTDDQCIPLVGCAHSNSSAACDDGDPCTEDDFCSGGMCVSTTGADCDDDNPCTDDFCQPLIGCSHSVNSSPCTDGNICTQGDQCGSGVCVPGAPLVCDDGNICTDDSCDPGEGCKFSPNDDGCDDNSLCTDNDQCDGGACKGTLITCDDDNPCTVDSCHPVIGCQHEPKDGPCSDGDVCTLNDACADGECQAGLPVVCNDNNVCTDDACEAYKGCQFEPNEAECDDQNACTEQDHCSGGACLGGVSTDCDDGDVCTNDLCSPADGCTHVVNAAPCDDEDVCTTGDMCQLGVCKGTGDLSCDDENPCTDDSCDPVAGCLHTANAALCNDGNACTVDDTCLNALCLGQVLDCNDGNLCTSDSCNPLVGCQNINNDNPCTDENACTSNDQCQGGVCVPGDQLNCEDDNECTNDACNPDQGCVHADLTGTDCSDLNTCTVDDKCQDGACIPGAALTCNDGDQCTNDSCNPLSGCVYAPISPCCGNGQVEAGEECDDGNLNGGDGCDAGCQNEPVCGNPGGGNLTKENGLGQNKYYCYSGGDSTQTKAKKACESHFGVGSCCVITGGYQNQQYGQCGGGGYGGSIHWHWDNHPNGHCGPYYKVGDVVAPGWCGSIKGNFLD